MSQENVDIVRAAWEAVQGDDQETAERLVDPEIEFLGTVGGVQEGETAHGRAEIDEKFEAQDLEAWEERRLEAEEYIDAGDNVVVFLHEYRRGRSSGIEVEAKTAFVAAVSGGRVVRMQGYLDRAAALEAAGLDRPV